MRWLLEREWGCSGLGIEEALTDVRWIDIETRKVDAPKEWPYRRRWQTFLVGVAGWIEPGVFFLEVVEGTEAELMKHLALNYEGCQMRYSATRDFDQMVLRGRFTNARRALSPVAGSWPNLDEDDFDWVNVRKELMGSVDRADDLPSKDVPDRWDAGDQEIVVTHCGRDVAEMVLADPLGEYVSDVTRAGLLGVLR